MAIILRDHIESYCFHFQGKRKYQEDNLYVDEGNQLFMVCDGIGGSDNGALASKKTIKFLRQRKDQLINVKSKEELKHIVTEVYHDLLKYVQQKQLNNNMGTTLLLLVIVQDTAYVTHVGDSKAFYFSGGKPRWISKDHSVVQELYDAGIIEDEKSMLTHPMKNRITSAIMADPEKKPPMIATKRLAPLHKGDFFILCTDGAVENYTNEDVIETFTNEQITLGSRWNLFKKNAEHSSDNSSGIMVIL